MHEILNVGLSDAYMSARSVFVSQTLGRRLSAAALSRPQGVPNGAFNRNVFAISGTPEILARAYDTPKPARGLHLNRPSPTAANVCARTQAANRKKVVVVRPHSLALVECESTVSTRRQRPFPKDLAWLAPGLRSYPHLPRDARWEFGRRS